MNLIEISAIKIIYDIKRFVNVKLTLIISTALSKDIIKKNIFIKETKKLLIKET